MFKFTGSSVSNLAEIATDASGIFADPAGARVIVDAIAGTTYTLAVANQGFSAPVMLRLRPGRPV